MRKAAVLMFGFAMLIGAGAPAQSPPGEAPPPGAEKGDPNWVDGAFTGPLIPFEAVNRGEPAGDRLGPARRLAAAIVAQDNSSPRFIADVGSFTGEFLQAFMQQFPNAKGQWTEPVDKNRTNAVRRLAPYGSRVTYRIGCPGRDLSQGCIPPEVDVLLTSWLSIHQNLPGIQKFYREAFAMLPTGGWLANLDHVTIGGAWDKRLAGARTAGTANALDAQTEGPPVHHADFVTPTLDDQLAGLRAAGFSDVHVVWQRLNTVLIMARKS